MTDLLIVFIIIVFILAFVFYEVMVSIGGSGVDPSKFLSDILKFKSHGKDETPEKTPACDPASMRKFHFMKLILPVLFIFAGTLIFYRIWDSEYGRVYRLHFFQAEDQLLLDFNKLEPISIESARREFKLNWFCRKERGPFGDSFCADELLEWNHMPALTVIFWFRDGVLTYVRLDVPPWHHDELVQYVHSAYGAPSAYASRGDFRDTLYRIKNMIKRSRSGDMNKETDRLAVWRMDTGALLIMDLQKDPDPLSWDTVFWMSPAVVRDNERQARQTGFRH